jgi:predicted acyltransferase (DUF342 family)
MLVLCFVLLAILFMLPFVPGAIEIIRKKDATPLFINMGYQKDPRYFAMSFRRMVLHSIGDRTEGLHDLTLSKLEKVRITENASSMDDTTLENVLYLRNDLGSVSNATFKKEVYARGNVHIGESNSMKALACDGDVHVGRGTHFSRWLDAEGDMKIDEECKLGISATCHGKLSISHKCSFMRLYGFPVATITSTPAKNDLDLVDWDNAALGGVLTERNISDLPHHSRKNCNIITDGALTIGEHCFIQGHVKSHGKIVVDPFVTVMGNLFAEGDIEIGAGSRIAGSVFSQSNIIIRQGVVIGIKNRIKSVVGKKGIHLEGGVQVYGYLSTDGKGIVA